MKCAISVLFMNDNIHRGLYNIENNEIFLEQDTLYTLALNIVEQGVIFRTLKPVIHGLVPGLRQAVPHAGGSIIS